MSKGGAMPGAGRPKGSLNKTTIERMAAKRHAISRIVKNTDKLLNAQLDKALGEKFLMVKRVEGSGAKQRTWHEVVDDPNTIIEYLVRRLTDNRVAVLRVRQLHVCTVLILLETLRQYERIFVLL